MNKNDRLEALKKYEILDTLPEKVFDDIVELASAICNTPISLISLLDSERQWFKARVGLDAPQTPLEYSFCHHAIQNPDEIFVVNDPLTDERFSHNPLVTGDPHIRFYAGAPLVTPEGVAFGALCVIDDKPREFTAEQQRMLSILAKKVIRELELRKKSIDQQQEVNDANSMADLTLTRLLEAEQIAHIGSWDWDIVRNEIYWSPEMYRLYGIDEKNAPPITIERWQQQIHPDDVAIVKGGIEFGFVNHMPGEIEYRIVKSDGSVVWLLGRGGGVANEQGEVTRLKGTVMDITARKKAEMNRQEYTDALEEMLFSFSHKIRRPVASCLGLIDVLSSGKFSEKEIEQFIAYFKESAGELDSYTRELTGLLHQKKLNIASEAH
jgi:PAS domain S-box-containing protein